MKILKEAATTAKKLPKGAWIAAVILPGGFIAIGVYITVKSIYKKGKK